MQPIDDPAAKAAVLADDRAHVFHSWSAQATLNPLAIAAAEGSYVYDYDGHEYLDLSSQLVNTNIGHQHPKVVAAIQAQAARLCTIAPQHANDVRGEAARLIVERAPEGFTHVFFTNGGTEAVEHAVRMARLHTGRHKVLATYRSYHGATGGAIAVNMTCKYLDFFPVVAKLAEASGLSWAYIHDPNTEDAFYRASSTWMVLSDNEELLANESFRKVCTRPRRGYASFPLWTDDYAPLAGILSW